MIEMADIVATHGDDYLREFGSRMLPSHRRALEDIRACRTAVMGGHLAECEECGHQRYSYHSCKNRSCPKCHGKETGAWLEKRETELLPVRYFHLVFTLPQELRDPVRRNQKALYAILMRSAVDALAKIGLDPKFVGGKLGILAVLHTWTRALEHHPHVHMLVPAGGLDQDGVWRESRKKFLVPVKALSKLFRERFMKLARRTLPQETFPQEVWAKEWVVFCKPAFNRAKKVLRYLGRYVHRIAITNNRLLALDNGMVRFRYQHSDTHQWQTMTLPAKEFLRRYLQHVLPQGFHKVRYYGLLSPANRQTLKRLQLLLAERFTPRQENDKIASWRVDIGNRCPCCEAGVMVVIDWLPRRSRSPPQRVRH
jgi:putative transposase/transposase-like zinc-binding protein